jgi:hypothetical protein
VGSVLTLYARLTFRSMSGTIGKLRLFSKVAKNRRTRMMP